MVAYLIYKIKPFAMLRIGNESSTFADVMRKAKIIERINKMSEAIIIAIISPLISGGAAIIVGVLSSNKTKALIEYKLDELTKKVEKHNNVIERTYKLEELTALQEEKIKVANHRIEDLERRCEHE